MGSVLESELGEKWRYSALKVYSIHAKSSIFKV